MRERREKKTEGENEMVENISECDILKFPLSANLCRWHVEMDRPAPLERSWE